jgi:hypothetical protein
LGWNWWRVWHFDAKSDPKLLLITAVAQHLLLSTLNTPSIWIQKGDPNTPSQLLVADLGHATFWSAVTGDNSFYLATKSESKLMFLVLALMAPYNMLPLYHSITTSWIQRVMCQC